QTPASRLLWHPWLRPGPSLFSSPKLCFASFSAIRSQDATIPGRLGRKFRGDEVDEGTHLCARMVVGKIDRIDREQLRGRLIHGECGQAAGAQIVGDDEGRLVDQTLARYRRDAERIAIVGPQVTGDRDADVALPAEHPAP